MLTEATSNHAKIFVSEIYQFTLKHFLSSLSRLKIWLKILKVHLGVSASGIPNFTKIFVS